MASNINAVVMVGNITRDIELRHTAGGTALAEFALALNGSEKVNGEWQDRVEFIDVIVWAGQAESCAQYLRKGSLCGVSGKLRQDRWDDKETGQKRSKVKVVADSVQFLDSRPRENGDDYRGAAEAQAAHEESQAAPTDPLPF